MMSLVRSLTTVIMLCAITTSVALADANESGGLVVMEVESVSPAGDWTRRTGIRGFTGSSYYEWEGANAFGLASAGRGVLTYRFRINRAGNYQLRWRSRIAEGNNPTEANDSWVRFPTGRNVAGEQPINTWTKVYSNGLNQWSWGSVTVDHVGRPIRQFFRAGDHTMQISGRSRGHALDRIVLYHYPSVSFSAARFEQLPVSSEVTGSSSRPEPEPVVTPATVVEPTPAPTPVPVVVPEPTPVPVAAPEPVEEPTPEPAPVTVVAPVQVEEPEPAPVAVAEPAPVLVEEPVVGESVMSVEGLHADVYSTSALELFWNRQSEQGVSYRIAVDGESRDVISGTSYYLDGLNEGRQYSFSVTVITGSGAESEAVTVQATPSAPVAVLSGQGPQPPQNASLVRYSSTAAELFWDRALTVEGIVGTDVYRDGNYLTTVPGNSFFDDARSPEQDYEYTLIAVDGAGGRSEPAAVTP